MIETSPVVFLNFNRPDKTRASLSRIREAKPRELFVFADGPRDGNEDDRKRCAEVRSILSNEVTWACKIWRYFPEKNMGCGVGVASAISLAFDYFEHAIIVEDDCILSQDFFSNTSKLLLAYAEDETIGAINANNFQDGITRGAGQYYRSKYFHCWGWATWKRVWKLYDFSMSSWSSDKNRQFWIDGCFSEEEVRFWSGVFNVMSSVNRVDTWDYQFTYAMFSNALQILTPNKNLVQNIGFGSDATHTKILSPLANLKCEDLPLTTICLPDYVDLFADQYTFWKLFASESADRRASLLSGLTAIEAARLDNDVERGLAACYALREHGRLPGLELHRAELLLAKGLTEDALTAINEEIEWFPGNQKSRHILNRITNLTSRTNFRAHGTQDRNSESLDSFVNIGCGLSFVSGWRNFDLLPVSADVEIFDIRRGIPMADESAEVVYSSHFIEHLSRAQADRFLEECYRILRPGGVIRLVFPDLENIAREYLKQLEHSTYGNEKEAINHEWMIVELTDQLTRHRSGGEMIQFISRIHPDHRGFIARRVGPWVTTVPKTTVTNEDLQVETHESVGRFRLSGEVHRWMYDSVSLKRLLRRVGFVEAKTVTPTSSRIPNFNRFKLDSNDGISPRKPDSSFVEAIKLVNSNSPSSNCPALSRRTPSCFSTIATKGVINDLRALLASLTLWMKGARIYIFSDTYTANKTAEMPFPVELDVRWEICLDPFSDLNRSQMEQKGLWSDFQLMKPKSMLHAFANGENDVMFLDADIFLMQPIALDDYSNQNVSLSRHHILEQMEKMYGAFNGGIVWTSSPEVVKFWMDRFPESRYYDQACLEDLYEKYECHVMHEGQNVSPYRVYRAPENPALVINRFSIEENRLRYKGIPVQFIHTHLSIKEGIFGAFNQLIQDLIETTGFEREKFMIRYFRDQS